MRKLAESPKPTPTNQGDDRQKPLATRNGHESQHEASDNSKNPVNRAIEQGLDDDDKKELHAEREPA